ncbi:MULTISPECIES: TerC family protein [Snodgrassella]|uniref:TerC family protein n=1 Tax=Snodgrassella TaxID=1193515 RepID=UPI0008160075|nr:MULTISPECIES: TerC family protein [Snodgrassella]SCC22081.1 Integral membrane protein TerC family protein [Snodgrassella sp. R-53583]
MQLNSVGTPLFYGVFIVIVIVMIAIDMLTLKKEGMHRVSTKEALLWTSVWIAVSLGFAGWLYFELAHNPAVGSDVAVDSVMDFLTGYVLEKSLSVDNIFVFVLIFSYFKIPAEYQHRVLLFGVLGAIVLRAIMVALGAVLVSRFEWVLYLFGVFLLYSGIKLMLPEKAEDKGLSDNPLVSWLNRHMRVSEQLNREKFFTIENGQRMATPLLLTLVVIELSDVVFAVDSIPAVFAVTTDPFIVFTSNIFAVLGLRAMYFLLANVVEKFIYLKYGLAVVLTFIGGKMLVAKWWHIPSFASLAVVFSALLIAIIASWLKTRQRPDIR